MFCNLLFKVHIFLKVNFTFRLIAEFVTLNLANQSISETDIMKIEN